jgi:DNA-binding transcriptional ArsR family regulator
MSDEVQDARKKNWFHIDNAVLTLGLKPHTLAVYMALARFADWTTGQCFPSLSKIAKAAGMSEDTARKHLTILVEVNLITIVERQREDGSQTSNLYTLLTVPETTPPLRNHTPPLLSNTTPINETSITKPTNAAEGGVTGAQESQNANDVIICIKCQKPVDVNIGYIVSIDGSVNTCYDCLSDSKRSQLDAIIAAQNTSYQPSPHCEPTQPQRKTVRRQDGGFSATTIDPFADKNDPNAPPPSPLIPTAHLSKPRQCETCGGYIMQVITQSGAKHNTCACAQHRLAATKNSAPTPQAPPLTPETLTAKHIDIIAQLLIAKRPQSIRGKKAATEELLRDGFIKRSLVRVGGYELISKGAALATDERVKKAVDDKQNAQGYLPSFMPNGGKKSDTKKVPYLRNDRDRSFYDAIFQAMDKTPDAVTISTRKFYAQVAREIADVADAVPADVLATAKYLQRTLDGKPFTPKAIAQWLIVGAAEQKTQYLNAESPPEDEIAPGTKPATPEQIAEAKRLTDQILGKSND